MICNSSKTPINLSFFSRAIFKGNSCFSCATLSRPYKERWEILVKFQGFRGHLRSKFKRALTAAPFGYIQKRCLKNQGRAQMPSELWAKISGLSTRALLSPCSMLAISSTLPHRGAGALVAWFCGGTLQKREPPMRAKRGRTKRVRCQDPGIPG